ncbi:hypothetical protein ACFO0N_03535 [Halobium salinum]|uniref:Uncharacterized protein n=1 Tax=Halobium salinum TaxID=1364940 RepID=A0ABD5P8I2_9EURY|nr:hypothetical protein [Halobium salinum]
MFGTLAAQGGIVDFLLGLDPVFVGLLVVILGLVFFLYLMARRTLLGLREGYDQGRGGR